MVREFGESIYEEMQMTTIQSIGAASACKKTLAWPNLPWPTINKQVLRLQMRIAKAERQGRIGKVKALQRLLTTSFYTKCWAVKRVTSNPGAKTSGVDGILWRTDQKKMEAVGALKRRGYQPSSLRRVYIPKDKGKKLRPLSIPTLRDRAMQAIWQAALLPIAEERADPNTYGFRPKRSAHDAIEQCFNTLSRATSASLILEGDIKSCFDTLSHKWLLENIPMDKIILEKFLKAGFIEKGQRLPTLSGTPQGGTLSPTLMVMALSGLERKLVSTRQRQRDKEKINVIFYADDFVVTAASQELLEEKVIPTIRQFLQDRGLELSVEKTKITTIDNGFDFLGFNVRKYKNRKLLIKPSKAGLEAFSGISETC